ncbi:FliH/SctL family protein [Microbacterium oryzae]|uniref:FliH/SctL family protein n=1 Tax=Microbacterium oryzae TaxID=743009 RepID=UPI0025B05510|nr:FliH/SctL family protein [Microbacterium oryzae]MDN3309656.1 FliH/SctL family protein [Microbacterium oryzae]
MSDRAGASALEADFVPLVPPRVGVGSVDARGEADRARSRGYADGYADGRRTALEEARRELVADRERAQRHQDEADRMAETALEALYRAHDALVERTAEVAALSVTRTEELAVELARVILGTELSDPARSAAHALRRGLAHASSGARLLLSERDHATLASGDLAAHLPDNVSLVASPGVDLGGVVVEVEDGAVDARIVAALARAEAALHGEDDAAIGAAG